MIVWPMLLMFVLGAVFGIWVFNPPLRKWVMSQVAKENEKDGQKEVSRRS